MMDLIKYENGSPVLAASVVEQLRYYQNQLNFVNTMADQLKAKIKTAMESEGIIKIETDEIVATLIPETDRETLDTKALKAELPEIYDSFVKMTRVKSSLRLKVK